MLYPQRNKFRHYIDLSGFWDFRFDPNDVGISENWAMGFEKGIPIAVPASWNDQFADDRDFLGPAWYQLKFQPPYEWDSKTIMIRFGSVNYLSDVWFDHQLVQLELIPAPTHRFTISRYAFRYMP